MAWKQDLTRAIREEVAAEQAATAAEEDRRRTWWATSWALAAVPRAEWGEAQALYVQRTGHNQSTAKHRRTTGTRLDESSLGGTLPQPRFGREAAEAIGKYGGDVAHYVKLLRQAERDEMSLREFHQLLTGSPWTSTPENLTEADEDAVVERVARTRPQKIAQAVTKPEVGQAVVEDPAAWSSVREGARNRTPQRTNPPRMPTPKVRDPQDVPERDLNTLELQAEITQYHIYTGDAEKAARKAEALYRRIQRHLTEEQRTDLAEISQNPIDAWSMVRDFIASGGATDEALQDLINQEAQGGSA